MERGCVERVPRRTRPRTRRGTRTHDTYASHSTALCMSIIQYCIEFRRDPCRLGFGHPGHQLSAPPRRTSSGDRATLGFSPSSRERPMVAVRARGHRGGHFPSALAAGASKGGFDPPPLIPSVPIISGAYASSTREGERQVLRCRRPVTRPCRVAADRREAGSRAYSRSSGCQRRTKDRAFLRTDRLEIGIVSPGHAGSPGARGSGRPTC